MRIGIVSYRFPPYNAVGGVSVGKTAKYLHRLGHGVRVITAADQPLEPSLELEIDSSQVVATKWLNLSLVPELALGGRASVVKSGFSTGGRKGAILKPLGRAYRAAVQVPDPQIGWYPYAVREGRRALAAWRPDVIFASAGPYTSLMAASRIARSIGVPWVAAFRDLWVDNPYRELPKLRQLLEARLERQVVGSAAGLVTVSEPLAQTLQAKYDVPVAVVTNGFDDEDFDAVDRDVTPPAGGGPLVMTYTGAVIEGRRDPTPLFRATKLLGLGADDVRIRFVGRYLDAVDDLRRREGVVGVVELHHPVPYRESLKLQRQSDVLLLLAWDDPREQGIVPGKIFEYLGSRRPILLLGSTDGVPSRLIAEREAGVTATDVSEIARAVEEWIRVKRAGGIPDLSNDNLVELTRRAQTERLAAFLADVVKGAA